MIIEDTFHIKGRYIAVIRDSVKEFYREGGKDYYKIIKKGDWITVNGKKLEVLDIEPFTASPEGLAVLRSVGIVTNKELPIGALIEYD